MHRQTSESVTTGHPDKICDQISDAILDELLKDDKQSRAAIECLVTDNHLTIAGETRSSTKINPEEIAQRTLRRIGYTDTSLGMSHNDVTINVHLNQQSPDIANGVDGDELGAGGQGMMIGYAVNETPEHMPLSHTLADQLTKQLQTVRANNTIDYLRPDGKAQVTVEQTNAERNASTIVLSTQHRETIDQDRLRDDLHKHVIQPVCHEHTTPETTYHINPAGPFTIGGPEADTGLTGRKIVVDHYGGASRVGGGAFSGKDPTKVDRTGAYLARYIAKNILAAKLATTCEVQLDYAIGVAKPVAITVNTYSTNTVPEHKIEDAVKHVFPLIPPSIIDTFDLQKPIYEDTARNGHFGRHQLPWEQTNKAKHLQKLIEGKGKPR